MTAISEAERRSATSVPEAAVDRAIDCVRRGDLLGYPTETVWGLGADASSDAALAKLRAFKGRADDAPVSVLLADPDAISAPDFDASPLARALASRFWPGPLTLVLPCRPRRFAVGVAREDGAVGVRCSSHPASALLAKRLSDAGVGPLTSTSLNRSGEPAARTRDEARAVRGAAGEAPMLLDTPLDAGGEEASTVLDVCGETPRVLRWGALASETLTPVLEEISAA